MIFTSLKCIVFVLLIIIVGIICALSGLVIGFGTGIVWSFQTLCGLLPLESSSHIDSI